MHDEKVKEAADRMRKHLAITGVNRSDDPYLQNRDQEWIDLFMIRDAYLTEHPADDDEPVTAKWWYEAVYGRYPQSTHEMWLSLNRTNNGACLVTMTSEVSFGTQARGDVRRLCRALGIELKESN